MSQQPTPPREIDEETANRHTTLNTTQARMVQAYAVAIAKLPRRFHSSAHLKEDDECELPYHDLPRNRYRQFSETGIISCEGSRQRRGTRCRIWSVPDEVLRRAREYVDDRETQIPGCPHSGLHNVTGTDRYTCTDDDCSNSVPREEVRSRC